jgi:hypothetical protein
MGRKPRKNRITQTVGAPTIWMRMERFYRRNKRVLDVLVFLLEFIVAVGGFIALLYGLLQWL